MDSSVKEAEEGWKIEVGELLFGFGMQCHVTNCLESEENGRFSLLRAYTMYTELSARMEYGIERFFIWGI